jgi:hypothetical protein
VIMKVNHWNIGCSKIPLLIKSFFYDQTSVYILKAYHSCHTVCLVKPPYPIFERYWMLKEADPGIDTQMPLFKTTELSITSIIFESSSQRHFSQTTTQGMWWKYWDIGELVNWIAFFSKKNSFYMHPRHFHHLLLSTWGRRRALLLASLRMNVVLSRLLIVSVYRYKWG